MELIVPLRHRSWNIQARTAVKLGAIQQASRLIGYSVSKLDVGGVACMELRFDSSAGATFSDAKCDTRAAHGFVLLIDVPLLTGIVSFNGWKSAAAASSRATTFRIG
jgi:hypothetical protein